MKNDDAGGMGGFSGALLYSDILRGLADTSSPPISPSNKRKKKKKKEFSCGPVLTSQRFVLYFSLRK